MWNTQDLARDFQAVGMETFAFEAGEWEYNLTDEFYPEEMERFQGIPVKNLGVMAVKPVTQ